jgi:AraC-like DNA-binding protein/predicted transcriptional regulator YdeE
VDYLAQVQRGIDYIEDHLDAELPLGDVARRAGISRWHFQRIFKALTNETLKTYIRSRRFACALEKLRETDERILEIALASGFDTQESFTRAFKRAFGVTPATYRRRKPRLPFPRKARFDADYLRHIHANVSLEPEMVERPATTLVGLRTPFYGVDSEKNNLGAKLPSLWAAFLGRMHEVPQRVAGRAYGVVRQCGEDSERLDYLAAAEVHACGDVPAGMVRLELAPTRYAQFTHRGPAAEVDRTVSYVYASWLLRSGLRHTSGPDLEIYDARYHAESAESVIEYAIPVTAGSPGPTSSPRTRR